MNHVHSACRSLANLTRRAGRVLGQLHRRPDGAPAWCLSCCEGLDRDHCDVIPFDS